MLPAAAAAAHIQKTVLSQVLQRQHTCASHVCTCILGYHVVCAGVLVLLLHPGTERQVVGALGELTVCKKYLLGDRNSADDTLQHCLVGIPVA